MATADEGSSAESVAVRRTALAALPPLRGLDASALDWLSDVVRPLEFAPGDVFVYERAPTRECYFVIEGETEVLVGGSKLGEGGRGDIEGEIALLFETPRFRNRPSCDRDADVRVVGGCLR